MLAAIVAGVIFAALHEHHSWWMSVLLAIPVFIGINLLFILLSRGGFLRLRVLGRIRSRVVDQLPDDAILVCRKADEGRQVQVVHFDRDQGKEVLLDAWSGRILTWSGGPRSALQLRGKARRQFQFGVVVFVLVMVPALAASLWFGYSQHWSGYCFAALVLLSNFVAYLLILPDSLAGPLADALDSVFD